MEPFWEYSFSFHPPVKSRPPSCQTPPIPPLSRMSSLLLTYLHFLLSTNHNAQSFPLPGETLFPVPENFPLMPSERIFVNPGYCHHIYLVLLRFVVILYCQVRSPTTFLFRSPPFPFSRAPYPLFPFRTDRRPFLFFLEYTVQGALSPLFFPPIQIPLFFSFSLLFCHL